mmetsp:Transcript_8467/g.9605  ORF Transcript_8467/g.9605 Transcript_8467/m.9605 type:complete len:102 (-) Transcript_8467:143-448(-)
MASTVIRKRLRRREFSPQTDDIPSLKNRNKEFSLDSIVERSPYVERLCSGLNLSRFKKGEKIDPLSQTNNEFFCPKLKLLECKFQKMKIKDRYVTLTIFIF